METSEKSTRRIKAFGLTGNIGCGKSTVGKMLAEYPDVVLFDCDSVATTVIEDEQNRFPIYAILGEDVFIDNKANFKRVAEIIFSDSFTKKAFETFVHAVVWQRIEKDVLNTPSENICIVESAIMYETGANEMFSGVIVVKCASDEQVRRLRENRNMTDEQIEAFINNQLNSITKESQADFVISTDCTLEQLKKDVRNLYKKLKTFKEKLS